MQIRASKSGMGQVGAAEIQAGQIVIPHILAGEACVAWRRMGHNGAHLVRGQVVRAGGAGGRHQAKRGENDGEWPWRLHQAGCFWL